MDTVWSGHVLEYYSVMKRSGASTLVTTWTDREHTTLGERRQTWKATHCDSIYVKYQGRHIHGDRGWVSGCLEAGGNGSACHWSRLDSGDGCTTL